MKNLIHSVKQTDYLVIVKTKSGITKTYLFPTIAACNEYYREITK